MREECDTDTVRMKIKRYIGDQISNMGVLALKEYTMNRNNMDKNR